MADSLKESLREEIRTVVQEVLAEYFPASGEEDSPTFGEEQTAGVAKVAELADQLGVPAEEEIGTSKGRPAKDKVRSLVGKIRRKVRQVKRTIKEASPYLIRLMGKGGEIDWDAEID
jgi:hypothetical protein